MWFMSLGKFLFVYRGKRNQTVLFISFCCKNNCQFKIKNFLFSRIEQYSVKIDIGNFVLEFLVIYDKINESDLKKLEIIFLK